MRALAWAGPARDPTPVYIAPFCTTAGGNPVTAVPGLTPMLPEITAEPVAVKVVPARPAKLCAAPSGGTLWANTGRNEPARKTAEIIRRLAEKCFLRRFMSGFLF